MPRGVVDIDGIHSSEMQALNNKKTPEGLPFKITKIGHVVLRCQDIEKSVKFYTDILGFRVSDVYPDSMVEGKMVFMRCNSDHHGVALVGGVEQPSKNNEMHHMAFEVDTLDEVLRAREHLKKNNVDVLELIKKEIHDLEPNIKPFYHGGVFYSKARHARNPKKILLKYFKTLENKSAKQLLDDTDCIIEIIPEKFSIWSY